jgi:hypothetical protein
MLCALRKTVINDRLWYEALQHSASGFIAVARAGISDTPDRVVSDPAPSRTLT